MKKILHSSLYSASWIVAGVTLFLCTTALLVNWNLMNWEPALEMETALCIAVIIAIEIFTIWMAKRTRENFSIIVSLLVCVALVMLGTFWFTGFLDESSQFDGSIWSRKRKSPIWFRITFLSLYLIPLISWFRYPFRDLKKSRKS